VRSLAVVLVLPACDLRSGIGQVAKPAGIQTLISQSPVKTLDMPVLHRSPGLNVDQLDLSFLAPTQEVPRGYDRFGFNALCIFPLLGFGAASVALSVYVKEVVPDPTPKCPKNRSYCPGRS
jgi:hypothetical protein